MAVHDRTPVPKTYSRQEVEACVVSALQELLQDDASLLQYDVAERAIAHKLAEYLQRHFDEYHVDCEYNRNVVPGDSRLGALSRDWRKILSMPGPRNNRNKRRNRQDQDDSAEFSVYPDIIVHRRLSNDHNLLVIEVKKSSSDVPRGFDRDKLCAFTATDGRNPYCYRYGLFILLHVRADILGQPELEWFKDGEPGVVVADGQLPYQLPLPLDSA